jgi:hypothetical protein
MECGNLLREQRELTIAASVYAPRDKFHEQSSGAWFKPRIYIAASRQWK